MHTGHGRAVANAEFKVVANRLSIVKIAQALKGVNIGSIMPWCHWFLYDPCKIPIQVDARGTIPQDG